MGVRLNLAAVPNSPYAAELLRAQQDLRFSPEVESEYVRTHLLDSRLLIRVTCALAAVLAIGRGVEQTAAGFPVGGPAIAIALVTIASVLLAALAWSSAFERHFLPFARVIVPIRNVVVAACIAAAAADGQREMLMFLPVLLFGPFFFLGLSYRTALFTSVLTAISYIVHAALFGLALPVALRSIAFLVIALAGCAVAARHLERLSRSSFLETRLISELAEHDTLTGTKNRRVFDEHLARVWSQAIAERRTIAILLIDVAVIDPSAARTPRGALQLADQALYAAKISGRNCVRVMNEADYGVLVTGVFAKQPSAEKV